MRSLASCSQAGGLLLYNGRAAEQRPVVTSVQDVSARARLPPRAHTLDTLTNTGMYTRMHEYRVAPTKCTTGARTLVTIPPPLPHAVGKLALGATTALRPATPRRNSLQQKLAASTRGLPPKAHTSDSQPKTQQLSREHVKLRVAVHGGRCCVVSAYRPNRAVRMLV